MSAWLAAVGLLLLVGVGANEALYLVQVQAAPVRLGLARANPTCILWHSQHKSAGRTIELTINSWPLKQAGISKKELKGCPSCRRVSICDTETWDSETLVCNIEPRSNSGAPIEIVERGYIPTLVGSKDWGRPGDGKCIWATMSREPVSRLLSAYFYCKGIGGKDALCGYSRADFSKITVREFAQHWGNYLFRELLWHTDLHEFAMRHADFNETAKQLNSEPWIQLKDQLNGGDDPRTLSGQANLKEVKKHLTGKASPLYDVYGVVEMWNESMALFDDKMPLFDNLTWADASGGYVVDHDSSQWKVQEEKAIEAARKDPLVLDELRADIELYNEVIVPMVKSQFRKLKA